MTNDEKKRPSGFVINSSFVIRHSSLTPLCPLPYPALESPNEFAAAADRRSRSANLRSGRSESGIDFQQGRVLPAHDGVLDARRAFQGANVPVRRRAGIAPALDRQRPAP